MAQGKQAKMLTPGQITQAIAHVHQSSRYPHRDALIIMLSTKAGLRAKEICNLTWGMVTDSTGAIDDDLRLPNWASKGKTGGRIIPVNTGLKQILLDYQQSQKISPDHDDALITSERGGRLTPNGLVHWFGALYKSLGFAGCSSHSGRHTFITNASRSISEAGGSIEDVRDLAGHTTIAMTGKYIYGNEEARRRVVNLI